MDLGWIEPKNEVLSDPKSTYWTTATMLEGGLGGTSPHSGGVVGPLRHEGGFGGDPPPHSRSVVWLPCIKRGGLGGILPPILGA